MEIILIKNGVPRLFLTPDDVIDEEFLKAMDGGTCRMVSNSKVEEDVTLSFGLLIEPPKDRELPKAPKNWSNLFGLIKT